MRYILTPARGLEHMHLRHRSASGDLDAMWEFDPVRRAIDVVMRIGSAAPIALTIDVCSVDAENRRADDRPIQRLDGETWRILPVRWRPAFGNEPGHFVDSAIHESIGHMHLFLSNAPPDVDAEMEAI